MKRGRKKIDDITTTTTITTNKNTKKRIKPLTQEEILKLQIEQIESCLIKYKSDKKSKTDPANTLKCKALNRKIQGLQDRLRVLKDTKRTINELKIHSIDYNKQLRFKTYNPQKKSYITETRLLPTNLYTMDEDKEESDIENNIEPVKEGKNIFNIFNISQKPRNRKRNHFDRKTELLSKVYNISDNASKRGRKKKKAQLDSLDDLVSENSIDKCFKCNVHKVVDRENGYSSCPKCGTTQSFSSYILDDKDNTNKNKEKKESQESLKKLMKGVAQWRINAPKIPVSVLEHVCKDYHKVHVHELTNIKPCKTREFADKKDILPKYKNQVELITKYIKNEPIPKFTDVQASLIQKQRNICINSDFFNDTTSNDIKEDNNNSTSSSSSTSNNKNNNNNNNTSVRKPMQSDMYSKVFGLSNNILPSRLFLNQKTNSIHFKHMKNMDLFCKTQNDINNENKNKNGNEMSWKMYKWP